MRIFALLAVFVAGLGGCTVETGGCPEGQALLYADADGDGYGQTDSSVCAQGAVAGYASMDGDCADVIADLGGRSVSGLVNGLRGINPGVLEVAGNGFDDDCDGEIDEAVGQDEVCYFLPDADGDRYAGSATISERACGVQPGFVANNASLGIENCDDSASVNPGVAETCDAVDNDCDGVNNEPGAIGSSVYYIDRDNDGFGSSSETRVACEIPVGFSANGGDCNDDSALVNPDVVELCSTVYDDDCDGVANEDDARGTTTYYPDSDRDGWGVATGARAFCAPPPSGYAVVRPAFDCNDNSATVNPGASETCNGVDDNCNGAVDDNAVNATTFFVDTDRDGYGSTRTETACVIRSGLVGNDDDCNDSRSDVFPGASEVCDAVDQNCNGQVDEGVKVTYYRDADGDSYGTPSTVALACPSGIPSGFVGNDDDCNDATSAIRPGAPEVCNTIDDDCDGQVDEAGATGGTTWYRDADGDAYGHPTQTQVACTAPSGYIPRAGDCDDLSSARFPGAQELCDGVDDNCNGVVDDNAVNRLTFYKDVDGDLFGDPTGLVLACSAPAGAVANNDDCDDRSKFIFPGAPEICNTLDDDCDGQIDEGVKHTYFRDTDADSFGGRDTTQACTLPAGYSANNDDCDDTRPLVNPSATEACNTYDDDCDGVIDEAGATGGTTFYRDADGDTYGVPSPTTLACSVPTGYSARSTDCNDNDPAVKPGAPELCNGIDDNCSGTADENAIDMTVFNLDRDGDSFGSMTETQAACTRTSGLVTNATDCDDLSQHINPSATEVCDGVDNNCVGGVDEGVKSTFYRDADGDLFAGSATTTQACTAPTGYYATSRDCNDSNASINPNASERCDGVDNDCDTIVDEDGAIGSATFYADTDGDSYGVASSTIQACTIRAGYASVAGDCAPTSPSRNPGALELCNDLDDDCDGQVDENPKPSDPATIEWLQDIDEDGWGNEDRPAIFACDEPANMPIRFTPVDEDGGDCNDLNPLVHPGAQEVAGNNIDDDCDGQVDETGSSGGGSSSGGSTSFASYNCYDHFSTCAISITCDGQGGAHMSVTATGPLASFTLANVGSPQTVRYMRSGGTIGSASFDSATLSATITRGEFTLSVEGSLATSLVSLERATITDRTLCRIERKGSAGSYEYRVNYIGP